MYSRMAVFWVVPLASNSGKWRFKFGSPTKNVMILLVTVTGKGDNPSCTTVLAIFIPRKMHRIYMIHQTLSFGDVTRTFFQVICLRFMWKKAGIPVFEGLKGNFLTFFLLDFHWIWQWNGTCPFDTSTCPLGIVVLSTFLSQELRSFFESCIVTPFDARNRHPRLCFGIKMAPEAQ